MKSVPQPSFDFSEPTEEPLSFYRRHKLTVGKADHHNRKYPIGSDSRSRIWCVWRSMHQRCLSKSHEAYERYGGRGITICAEWLHQYENFRIWALGNGYAGNLTIDRIDNDKGYSPENCRWSTWQDQALNTRSVLMLTGWGETKCAAEWAHDPRCKVGTNKFYRLINEGYSVEEACIDPDKSGTTCIRMHTAFGEPSHLLNGRKTHDVRFRLQRFTTELEKTEATLGLPKV